MIKNNKVILKNVLNVIFILSPCILVAVLSLVFKIDLFNLKPVWSDEIGYWKEIFSFAGFGFNTGYIGINEAIPRFCQFSTHGFFPALFYYPFAKILNWPNNGILISNLIFIIICFTLVVILFKPNLYQTISFIIIYLLFPPIILYATTSMTEALNYGFLALFSVFFYKYLNSNGNNKKIFLFLTLFVGIICSFYRIIYITFFLIMILVLSEFKLNKKFFKFFLIWILSSGALYLISSVFTSPYYYGFLYNFINASNLKTSLLLLIYNIKNNIINYFSLSYGDRIEVYFRMFYFLTTIFYLFFIFFKISINKGKKFFLSLSVREKFNRFNIAQFILLLIPLVIVIAVYDVYSYRDLRALAPFLWISFFNLIVYKRSAMLKSLTVVFVVFFLLSLSCMPKKMVRETAVTEPRDFTLIQNVVRYEENAEDPFENTLLTDVFFDFELWSNVNQGIGIEWMGQGFDLEKAKSRYILISQDEDIAGYEKEGKTDFGYLYKKIEVG